MKAPVLLLLVLCSALLAQAQIMDSLDNLVLKIPAGWEVKKHGTYTELTKFNKTRNSFCHLAIYQQQPASGDKYASFTLEWEGLVLAYFETSETPAPQTRKTKNGNVLYYGAQVVNKINKLSYYTELHVYDCGSYVQSVLVMAGIKKHLHDSLWQPLIVGVKKNSASTLPAATGTAASNPFNGKWGKAGSSDMSVDAGAVLINVGSYKCQYDFKPDGTYALRGEAWGGYMRANDYTRIDESGTYKVSEQQLSLIPSKGKLQKLNRDGKVLKSENLAISKRTYSWQLHYFEGLNETQLVLTPAMQYTWDGGAGGNSLFPNGLLLSQQYKPEWRFK